MVLSGLLADDVLGDDRDRLATVLAHEVAHALLQHSREGIGRAWTAQGLAWIMAKSLKIGAVREDQMVRGLRAALLDPHSRARETEADVLGLELMARAGFTPSKAVETWERMAAQSDPSLRTAPVQRAVAFLTDHPSDLERLERMKTLQPKAQPLAEAARQWDWLTQGVDDAQSEALSRAANAFGLDRVNLVNDRVLVGKVAAAERLSPKQAAAEIERAMWETALDQGGALQMALSAMVRAADGWERLGRIEPAWAKLRQPKPLLLAPEQVKKLPLSDDDRAIARELQRPQVPASKAAGVAEPALDKAGAELLGARRLGVVACPRQGREQGRDRAEGVEKGGRARRGLSRGIVIHEDGDATLRRRSAPEPGKTGHPISQRPHPLLQGLEARLGGRRYG